MENQRVKDVRSLYSLLTSVAETWSPIQDMKAISMFPGYSGELVSITDLYNDMVKEKEIIQQKLLRKRKGILQFFNL
jgi:hypothetical protein